MFLPAAFLSEKARSFGRAAVGVSSASVSQPHRFAQPAGDRSMKVSVLAAALAVALAGTASAQVRPVFRPPPPPPPVTVTTPQARPSVAVHTPQVRPLVTPPMRVCAVPRCGLITRSVHGNSLSSNRSQHVYGIFRTDTTTGQTRLSKFGISDGGTLGSGATGRKILAPTREYSIRAETQARQWNAEAVRTGEQAKYHTRILQRVPEQPAGGPTARQLAVSSEKGLVTQARIKNEAAVPENQRPSPYGYSRIPAKK
jgi:hypothetical protein